MSEIKCEEYCLLINNMTTIESFNDVKIRAYSSAVFVFKE